MMNELTIYDVDVPYMGGLLEYLWLDAYMDGWDYYLAFLDGMGGRHTFFIFGY